MAEVREEERGNTGGSQGRRERAVYEGIMDRKWCQGFRKIAISSPSFSILFLFC